MKNYSEYINPYMEMILTNQVEHCDDQEKMILNNIIPVLEREDTYINDIEIEKGLKLQKYFPYKLIEWEVFLFACIVGVRFKESEDVYFDEIRIEVGRGAGKNGFISFLCFYFLSPAHGIKGYNIEILANSEDQAKVSFDDVYELCKHPTPGAQKAINSNFYPTKTVITGKKTNSKLKYNSSSKRGKDSKRTGCVILDEKHEYMDSDIVNTLKSGLGKVKNARIIGITTKGHIRGGLLDKEDEQNRHILNRYDPDNRTLVFSCHIEEEKEGMQPEKWIKANPSINNFKELKKIITKEVKDMPYNMDYYPEFMAKRMNFPVGNKDVEIASWDDILQTNKTVPDLSGKPCILGLDYANTNDFVGCVLLFRIDDEYIIKHKSFVCVHSRDLPGIKAPLKEWAERDILDFVDDVEIAPHYITTWVSEQMKKYKIKKVVIDKYRFQLLNKALTELGFDANDKEKKNVKLARKSDIMLVAPLINSCFVSHKFIWGDDPMMRWYANNTKKVLRNDGNTMYEKIEPHYRKTDGFMALAAAMTCVDDIKPVVVAKIVDIPTLTF